eukprot:2964450-Rhodomonas_salina.1
MLRVGALAEDLQGGAVCGSACSEMLCVGRDAGEAGLPLRPARVARSKEAEKGGLRGVREGERG